MRIIHFQNLICQKITFVFYLIFLLPGICSAQPFTQWAKSIGSADQEYGNAVCSDSNGNIYIGGSYYNNLIICDDTLPIVARYSYEGNLFISKFDSMGNCIWSKAGISPNDFINGAPVAQVYDIKYFNGNIFCVGAFYDSLIFENDTLANSCPTLCGSSFVMNLDSSGHLVWIRLLRDTLNYTDANVVVPTNDGVLVAGDYVGALTIDSVQLIAYRPSDMNACLLKFNLAGECMWGKTIGISEHSLIDDMVYDNDRNIYFTGEYNSTFILPGTTLRDTPYIHPSTFLAKYDTAGNFIWARGGSDEIRGNIFHHKLCINNTGDIYFTGTFTGTAMISSTFTTQPYQNYEDIIAKYDTSGTHIWAFATGNKQPFQEFSSCINSSGPGFILASVFNDTIIVGPDSLIANGTSTDLLLTQYDEDGNVFWNKHFGGAEYEIPQDIYGGNGSLYLCGTTSYPYNIDTFPIASYGSRDILLAKFKLPTNISGIIEPASEQAIDFRIFPNPSRSTIKVFCNKIIDDITITNILGQIVYSASPKAEELILQIEHEGIYFLNFSVDGKTQTRKLIVNH